MFWQAFHEFGVDWGKVYMSHSIHLINMGFFVFHSGQGGNGRWVAYLEFPVVRSALISCEKTSVYKIFPAIETRAWCRFFLAEICKEAC